jgi:Domain of unknown function (DUF4156)
MKKLIGTYFVVIFLAGCTASQVQIDSASLNVQIATTPPKGNVVQLGPVTARHGGGCGLYGAEGNFEGAATILRNKAARMGANYVQIIHQQGEHMTGICLDRGYTIDAMAYHVEAEPASGTAKQEAGI